MYRINGTEININTMYNHEGTDYCRLRLHSDPLGRKQNPARQPILYALKQQCSTLKDPKTKSVSI